MTLKQHEREAASRSECESRLPSTGSPLVSPRLSSNVRIYETMMRSGGEPFGAPFEVGVSSLTTKVVEFFRQAGFFGFETLERLMVRNRRNKFTRHGSAPFTGDLLRRTPPNQKTKK